MKEYNTEIMKVVKKSVWQRFKAAIMENNSSLRNWHIENLTQMKKRKVSANTCKISQEPNGIWELKNAITENKTQ